MLGLLFTRPGFSAGYDVCVCVYPTGNSDGYGQSSEVGFYKAGCAAYLAVTKCKEQELLPMGRGFTVEGLQRVFEKNPGKSVNLSYVGHWSNAKRFAQFLNQNVVPSIQSTGCSVDVYNSACRAGNNPLELEDPLKNLGPLGNKLRIQANQPISLGVWDAILPGKNNLPVVVDSQGVHLPECNQYLGSVCNIVGTGKYQSGEVGACRNGAGENQFLICLETQQKVVRLRNPGPASAKSGPNGHEKVFERRATWQALSSSAVRSEIQRFRQGSRSMDRYGRLVIRSGDEQIELFGNLGFQNQDEAVSFLEQALVSEVDPMKFFEAQTQARRCQE